MNQPAPPLRILPAIDLDSQRYWTSGKDGVLVIFKCHSCATYVHPPVPFCPACESVEVEPAPVSGRGRVETFTINHKAWVPGLPVPYVLALVALEEAPEVRLVGNITHCDPAEVTFGMPVDVWFEPAEDLWIPLFRPVGGAV
ncbi:putative OB-fold protein [Porphyrobacter sp. MBR-155]|jgi:uncharacterized OB-fold protein|uniref:Zn-ribbon domain-containing OB-fold protein n=1 Tax=Porphyrobacter sp. MBR-155 TaxID=3156464 RepID=UPI00339B3330